MSRGSAAGDISAAVRLFSVAARGHTSRMRTLPAFAVLAAALFVAACATGTSQAHESSCHADQSCPSDDHSYVWSGMSCASDPAARLPEDQLPIDHRGVRYWCHVVVDEQMTPRGSSRQPASCLVARGAVRTLTDGAAPRVRPRPTETSIASLASLRPPRTFATRASGAERTRYRVRARLVNAVTAADGELRVVLADPAGGRTITASFPAARCTLGAPAGMRQEMAAARSAFASACGSIGSRRVALRGTATVVGVGFFARSSRPGNGFGLAPVLHLAAARCARG